MFEIVLLVVELGFQTRPFLGLSRALLLIWKVSVPTTPIGLKWEQCQKSSCRLYIALGALPSYTVWREVKRLSDLPEDTHRF